MKRFYIQYSQKYNAETDGRKKPKFEIGKYLFEYSSPYKTLDDAEDYIKTHLRDVFDIQIYEANFTLVKELEAAE
jgi:hypothetical protein